MPTIQWDESYSVNNDEIDNQHKKWIGIFNKMHSTLINGDLKEVNVIGQNILQDMIDYATYHFSFEEAYMKKIGYPDIVAHRRLHKDFDSMIYQHHQKMHDGCATLLNTEIVTIIKNWLINHILIEDMKYAKFVEESDTEQI